MSIFGIKSGTFPWLNQNFSIMKDEADSEFEIYAESVEFENFNALSNVKISILAGSLLTDSRNQFSRLILLPSRFLTHFQVWHSSSSFLHSSPYYVALFVIFRFNVFLCLLAVKLEGGETSMLTQNALVLFFLWFRFRYSCYYYEIRKNWLN